MLDHENLSFSTASTPQSSDPWAQQPPASSTLGLGCPFLEKSKCVLFMHHCKKLTWITLSKRAKEDRDYERTLQYWGKGHSVSQQMKYVIYINRTMLTHKFVCGGAHLCTVLPGHRLSNCQLELWNPPNPAKLTCCPCSKNLPNYVKSHRLIHDALDFSILS